MNMKERVALAEALADQGGEARRTKSGFLVKNPATKLTVAWHVAASSDHRGAKNLRRDVIRAGFQWPADTEKRKAA